MAENCLFLAFRRRVLYSLSRSAHFYPQSPTQKVLLLSQYLPGVFRVNWDDKMYDTMSIDNVCSNNRVKLANNGYPQLVTISKTKQQPSALPTD